MSEGPRTPHPAEPPDSHQQAPMETGPDDNAAGRTQQSGGLSRLPWVIAWACSVIVAFLLGTQSTSLVKPQGSTPAPQTSTAAQSAPAQTDPGQSAPPSGAQTVEPDVAEMLKKLARREPSDGTAKGRVDAKVVLIEWSDYRCPYCAVWHTQTLPVLQKYVDNGTLRIEYRDYPIFGDQSTETAIAARAAGNQGKFWEFQDAVFSAAPKNGHPDIPRPKILEFASKAGVQDMKAFEADLSNTQLKDAVNADAAKARELGISGTPFFVINGGYINGARPAGDFIQAIESAAKQ